MMKIRTIGINLAKGAFQAHGADEHGKIVLRKQLKQELRVRKLRQFPSFRGDVVERRLRLYGHLRFVPTNRFMGTNSKAVVPSKRHRPCLHHPPALKRSAAAETLQPSTSVAWIARKQGINADQVLLWHKAYRKARSLRRSQPCCRSSLATTSPPDAPI